MGGAGGKEPSVGLAGREHDCAAIDRLFEDALGGDSGSLMVRGEAGIGAGPL
jgi:predicted ATPase